MPVDGLSEVTAISAGGDFSLALGALAPLPRVTGLGAESGPAGGGTSVTILGSNFTGATAVRFGSVPAELHGRLRKPNSPRFSPPHAGTDYAKFPSNFIITRPRHGLRDSADRCGHEPGEHRRRSLLYGPPEETHSKSSTEPGGLSAPSPSTHGAAPGGTLAAKTTSAPTPHPAAEARHDAQAVREAQTQEQARSVHEAGSQEVRRSGQEGE